VSNYVLGLLLSILLILSGIGLLRMKVWAWWTSVIFGAVTVIWNTAHFVFAWNYINPVMARWTKELAGKQPPGTPNFTTFSENPVIQGILAGGGLILSIG